MVFRSFTFFMSGSWRIVDYFDPDGSRVAVR